MREVAHSFFPVSLFLSLSQSLALSLLFANCNYLALLSVARLSMEVAVMEGGGAGVSGGCVRGGGSGGEGGGGLEGSGVS